MKRKIVFGVLIALLVFQAQSVFGSDEDFVKEAKRNNVRNIERLLERRANRMDLAYCTDYTLRKDSGLTVNNIIPVLESLKRNGADFSRNYSYNGQGFAMSSSPVVRVLGNDSINDAILYDIVQFLLRNGAKADALSWDYYSSSGNWFYTSSLGRSLNKPSIFNLLLENGANINVRLEKDETILIRAAQNDNFNHVKMLVENGANVNLRAENGSTAASIAYDRGNIEIYNYLKANGAIDFEPRQVSQPAAPAQTTTTTQSAPAQSAPQQSAPATPVLRAGTYAASGTNHTMALVRFNDTSGNISYYDGGALAIGHGSYRISNNQLTLTFNAASSNAGLRNKTFIYNITSDTSFSGNGENWSRIR